MSNNNPTYHFMPWLREGMGLNSNNLDTNKPGPGSALRSTIEVMVDIEENNSKKTEVIKDIELLGAVDVRGINPQVISAMYPKPGSDNMEPNYLPFIEFFDEDLPWRFTPGTPTGNDLKHRPWLALVVLTDAEGTVSAEQGSPLPVLTVKKKYLPESEKIWAFAHVQGNNQFGNTSSQSAVKGDIKETQSQAPDQLFSRVLSSRKLSPTAKYTAYVVPTYGVGAFAGMGRNPQDFLDGTTSPMAWNSAVDPELFIELPIYHSWSFTTTEAGDFEDLVRALNPGDLGETVGVQPIDIRQPGLSINEGPSLDYTTEVVGMQGALRHENMTNYPYNANDEANIRTRLNDELKKAGQLTMLTLGEVGSEDPVVTLPLYGRWYSMVRDASGDPNQWVNELNLSFTHRAAAGLGAQVARDNQETFMARAWEQVGRIKEANHEIILEQVQMEANYALFINHLQNLLAERVYQATLELQKKNRAATGKSLLHEAKNAHLKTASASSGFQKVAHKKSKWVRQLDRQVGSTTTSVADNFVTNLGSKADTAKKITLAEKPKSSSFFAQVGSTDLADLGNDANTIFAANAGDPFTVLNYSVCSASSCSLMNSFQVMDQYVQNIGIELERDELDLTTHKEQILEAIDPQKSYREVIARMIKCHAPPLALIQPILETPHFGEAMFRYLRDKSPDHLLPNVGDIEENTVALMETNPAFIDAFMVGLNHEMNREFLWRQFPTDLRGTPFRQFWNPKEYYEEASQSDSTLHDIRPINEWSLSTSLGDASHTGSLAQTARSGKVTLLIRGDLFKRYPNTRIFAVKARFGAADSNRTEPDLDANDQASQMKFPIFQGSMEPDIQFFGFDLTTAAAKGSGANAGWYFVIEERVGDLRFGLDVQTENPSGNNITEWNKLGWDFWNVQNGSFLDPDATEPTVSGSNIEYGKSAADMAYILMQQPVRAYMHAQRLIKG